MFSNLLGQVKREPLALLAIILTALGFIYEREFFQRWLRVEPTVTSYHLTQADGRCPMVAFEVENKGHELASNIRISILEDWITARGDEELLIFTFEEAIIGEGEVGVMARRIPLHVLTVIDGNTLIIPELLPGEYVQRLFGIAISSDMRSQRAKLAKDPVQRVRPKIGRASYEGGVIDVALIVDCLDP